MIIYIHCKGGNKDNISKIIKGFDLPYASFDAPFEYKEGFFWFDKDKNGAADANMVELSVDFIVSQIKELNTNNEEIVLICHSQGGVMAILVSHKIKIAKIITLGADIHKGIELPAKAPDTTIIWFEAENDKVLSEERIKSVNQLVNKDYDIKILKPLGSTHSSFEYKDIKKYL